MLKSARFSPKVEQLEDRYTPATLTVTTLKDDVSGSLRSAIREANRTAAADTIVFAPGLTGMIALTRGEDIDITSNLTIAGPGANNLAISGNFTSRIFRIDNDLPGPDVTVKLSGLELSYGSVLGRGGAIWTQENLTLNGVRFTHNEATSEGGAVEAGFATGNLKVVNCSFIGNTARLGGAIYVYGNTTITGSTFLSNTATHTNGGGGGGVSCSGPTTISTSKFQGNQAPGVSGGGIRHAEGKLTILNCKISGNRSGVEGGGISAENLTISGSIVSNNRAFAAAENGGGGGISCTVATISGCSISFNRADFGGALSCLSANIKASSIADNYALHAGGGIYAMFLVAMKGSTVSSNLAQGGGGIFCGEATLEACTIEWNRAITGTGFGEGGGLSCHTTTLKGCTFYANLSDGGGGGLRLRTGGSGNLISNCTFSGNVAYRGGGGLYLDLTSYLTLSYVTIAHNFAASGPESQGGGIFLSSLSTFGGQLYGCLIANNSADVGPDVRAAVGKGFEGQRCLIGSYLSTDASLYDSEAETYISPSNPGTFLFNVDPRLAPLANNGGKTKTHALKAASPAINKGHSDRIFGLDATDQRGAGFKRKAGPALDIGAFERQ